MFRQLPIAPAALACIALAGCSANSGTANSGLKDSTPVIEAAGLAITKAEFEKLMAEDARMAAAQKSPEAKLALGTDIGKAFALEAEARRRKLDQEPAVQLKIRDATQRLLTAELELRLRGDYQKSESALRTLYEKNKAQYEEPHVRQILVRFKGSQVALRKGRPDLTEAQARAKAEDLLAKLTRGADFAKLATAESDDLGSLTSGGDIGFIHKGATEAPFEAAAYSLAVGQLSKVIRTQYGFHIIRVEERKPIDFQNVEDTLANELAHREMDGIILNGYKLNEAYFGKKP